MHPSTPCQVKKGERHDWHHERTKHGQFERQWSMIPSLDWPQRCYQLISEPLQDLLLLLPTTICEKETKKQMKWSNMTWPFYRQ
jgi:hypothetical protein